MMLVLLTLFCESGIRKWSLARELVLTGIKLLY